MQWDLFTAFSPKTLLKLSLKYLRLNQKSLRQMLFLLYPSTEFHHYFARFNVEQRQHIETKCRYQHLHVILNCSYVVFIKVYLLRLQLFYLYLLSLINDG